MKKVFLFIAAEIMTAATAVAQQIAVVAPNGSTKIYTQFDKAVEGAESGSVMYLSNGGFKTNDVKITKKLTIIGLTHKSNAGNADGSTTVQGNINFRDGSTGSSIMGCYVNGDVNIAEGGGKVNNVLVRYCNVNSIYVKNDSCTGTTVNQCYVRGQIGGSYADMKITNNIIGGNKFYIKAGTISNNICLSSGNSIVFEGLYGCIITNNVLKGVTLWDTVDKDQASGNLCPSGSSFGADYVTYENWDDLFVNSTPGVHPSSDFHFTDAYSQYKDIGIYGGTGFNDGALPPVPYVVSKVIPDQTDSEGKLNIKIAVKAGE